MKKHYALIGRALEHSYSKRYFDDMLFPNADYQLCAMDSVTDIRQWVQREQVLGFNVTFPHKVSVATMLDSLSPTAQAVGAVNCVVCRGNRLEGYNTDAPAFRTVFARLPMVERALVLGTGGASLAVGYALGELGVPYARVSRRPQQHEADCLSYAEARQVVKATGAVALINATPVGTYPNINLSPWPWADELHEGCVVYDLVYNPSPTQLLRQATAADATVEDGLSMLRLQAEFSWRLWGLL